jgi:hypothetical protein
MLGATYKNITDKINSYIQLKHKKLYEVSKKVFNKFPSTEELKNTTM